MCPLFFKGGIMWYYESDGGNFIMDGREVYCPETHYVINSVSGERIDMESKRSAKEFIRQRNSRSRVCRGENVKKSIISVNFTK